MQHREQLRTKIKQETDRKGKMVIQSQNPVIQEENIELTIGGRVCKLLVSQ
jgi:hypothetical protein